MPFAWKSQDVLPVLQYSSPMAKLVRPRYANHKCTLLCCPIICWCAWPWPPSSLFLRLIAASNKCSARLARLARSSWQGCRSKSWSRMRAASALHIPELRGQLLCVQGSGGARYAPCRPPTSCNLLA
eukprot:1158643-Pelagomonas_calceolata.AAC.2